MHRNRKGSDQSYKSKRRLRQEPRESCPRRIKKKNINYSDLKDSAEMADSDSVSDVVETRPTPVAPTAPLTAADPTVVSLLQMMLEDRRKEDERRQQEEEDRRKERKEERDAQQQFLKTILESKYKEMTEASQTRKEEDKADKALKEEEERVERALSRLPRMREGDDLEELVCHVEAKMKMDNVPVNKWKGALLDCLSPKAMALAHDVLKDHDSSYSDVKKRLLDCSGLTAPMAGEFIFSNNKPTFSGTDVASPLRKIYRWVLKAIEGATTLAEAAEKITLCRVKAEMSESGKAYIDNRNPQTIEDMRSTLSQYVATHGSIESALKWKEQFQKNASKRLQLGCFTCGKPGHIASQCWSKQRVKREQESSTTTGDMKTIVCFTCHEAGH